MNAPCDFGLNANVNNDELREIVKADPSQTTQELTAWFNVTLPTILTRLCQINTIKKYEKWVPHDLTDMQKETRVETCVALFSRYRNEGILDQPSSSVFTRPCSNEHQFFS
jgi:[histone H3]-lysine36 N-dimethyltransferase SETMAR